MNYHQPDTHQIRTFLPLNPHNSIIRLDILSSNISPPQQITDLRISLLLSPIITFTKIFHYHPNSFILGVALVMSLFVSVNIDTTIHENYDDNQFCYRQVLSSDSLWDQVRWLYAE